MEIIGRDMGGVKSSEPPGVGTGLPGGPDSGRVTLLDQNREVGRETGKIKGLEAYPAERRGKVTLDFP